MAKTTANISIDPEVKARAQELFADFGMDLSTAINIFLRQAIYENAIPFEISRRTPNDDTIAAMDEYFEMQRHPEKYKRYASFKDAMREVLEDA
ncbi:MAG: type II toxin-antitoxin system RelB/DinJ family antitoxin [Clostridia bacterium]|nr:type II toxin-antitoxin system RelB/DinJ family antitoxin [Clostridia bacterium]